MVELARIKRSCGMDSNDTAYDAFLQELLDEAVAAIRRIAEQPVLAGEDPVTHTFEGNARLYYTLPYLVASDLTLLEHWVGPKADPDDNWVAITTPYALLEINEIPTIVSDQGFIRGGLYRATLVLGYAAADMPEDLKRVAVQMVATGLKESGYRGDDGQSASIGEERLGMASISTTFQATQMTETKTFRDQLPAWTRVIRTYFGTAYAARAATKE